MAGEFQAGDVVVPVAPSAKDFIKDLRKEILPPAYKLGIDIGKDIARGIKDAARGVYEPLSEEHKKQQKKAPKQGEEQGGAFAQGFKKRLQAAMKTLPKAEIDADSSEADKKVQRLRARLEGLGEKTIGVDIESADAVAELRAVQGELEALQSDADIQVRADATAALTQLRVLSGEVDKLTAADAEVEVDADTAAAQVQLGAVAAQVDDLDGRRVSVDTVPAVGGFMALALAAGTAAAVPVGATLAAGLGALTGPLAAAGAGFGSLALVAVPAITEISEALKFQEQAAAGSAAAAEKYAAALAQMSPAARTLMSDWQGLTAEFTAWRQSVEGPVLGIFSDGINVLSGRFEALTPLVRSSAGAVRGLISDMDTALSSPFWEQLGRDVTAAAPGAITSFGRIGGAVATGLAGIVSAFLPYAPTILGFVEDIAAGFASWGKGLGGSPAFAAFLNYVREVAPSVRELFASLGPAVANVLTALAPLGPVVLKIATALADMIAAVPPGVITALVGGLLAIGVAIKAVAAGSALASIANPVGLIIAGIVALVGVLIYCYHRFEAFRDIVNRAFQAIASAAQWVWANFLKPVFDAFVEALQTHIIPAVMRMWRDVLVPAFREIASVVQWAWRNVIQPALKLYAAYITNILIPAVLWLWKWVIVPAFYAIAAVISFAWNTIIKPVFRLLWWTIQNVLIPVVLFLWRHVIVPAWKGIAAAVEFAWNTIIKPIWAGIRAYINRVLNPVFLFLWRRVIKPVWKGISLAIKIAWGIIKIIFKAIVFVLRKTLGPVFRWLWRNIIQPVWNGIKKAINTVWRFVRDKVFSPMRKGTGRLGKAFQAARKVIAKAWNGIKNAAKTPVRFMVRTVYNDGIRKMWNKVAGIVDADKLPKINLPKGFASGGILGGASSWYHGDSMLMPVRPGEGWYVSEAMRDPYERARLMAVNKAAIQGRSLAPFQSGEALGGITGGRARGGFARGGWLGVGDISPPVGDIVSAVGKFLKKIAVDVFTGDLGGAVKTAISPMRSALGMFGKDGIPGIPYMLMGNIGKSLRAKVQEFLAFFSASGAGPVITGAKGQAGDVVRLAAASVGKYPEVPGGSNTNAITRWYGMSGQPWCAMFISWLFAKAGASGSLGRAARTAWTGDYYTSGMRRVAHGNRRPGDVAVYGTNHVNLVTGPSSRIGGNESNNVRISNRRGGAIFRPFWKGAALGGVLTQRRLSRIANQDPHDRPTPISRELAAYAAGTSGAARGLAWVGEHGPELVAFNGGETVYPAEVSRTLAAALGLQAPGYAAGTLPGYRGVGTVSSTTGRSDPVRYTARDGQTVINVQPPPATVRELVDGVTFALRKDRMGGRYKGGR